jgi:hypothetical protein
VRWATVQARACPWAARPRALSGATCRAQEGRGSPARVRADVARRGRARSTQVSARSTRCSKMSQPYRLATSASARSHARRASKNAARRRRRGMRAAPRPTRAPHSRTLAQALRSNPVQTAWRLNDGEQKIFAQTCDGVKPALKLMCVLAYVIGALQGTDKRNCKQMRARVGGQESLLYHVVVAEQDVRGHRRTLVRAIRNRGVDIIISGTKAKAREMVYYIMGLAGGCTCNDARTRRHRIKLRSTRGSSGWFDGSQQRRPPRSIPAPLAIHPPSG